VPLAANRGPVYLLGTGESVETPDGQLTRHSRESGNPAPQGYWPAPGPPLSRGRRKNTSSCAFRVAGPKAFAEAGITHSDVDYLMIYGAPCSLPRASFAHLPVYRLEDLGFVPRGEAGRFFAERNTAPGNKLPLNTNGGGLSYMHSGVYALQESVRQMRGIAPAQTPDAKISVCHGVGGMFAASGTIIMPNEPP
jgi:acetyl-CoA acetyltransferase